MNKVKKPVFFVVFALIVLFVYSVLCGFSTYYGDITTKYIKGVSDIRMGIDIRGGVDVTFTPPEGFDADDSQLDSAKEVIVQRMINLGITDYESYIDYNNDRIIVRFPWKEGEADFDPESAVKELGETAMLTFREGYEVDSMGLPTGVTADTIILEGKDVKNAYAAYTTNDAGHTQWVVALELSNIGENGEKSGADKFSDATKRLAETKGQISIWMDDFCISYPTVNEWISGGSATITGDFDADSAKALADKINSGALPFKLVTSSFSTISPSLGMGALDAMVLAGIIAFCLIAVYVIVIYRLPGFVAVIALAGQVAGMLAFVSGYFSFMNSSILTIPGIAGIILSVGMGVDANIITSERIKEELRAGKTLDGALNSGFKRAFAAIFDGNVTMIIIAIILMGAFGTPDSLFAKLLHPVFFMFGPSTAGTIYSFGYNLLTGCFLNFLMGVFCSRIMLYSISRFKAFRNPKLYGGV